METITGLWIVAGLFLFVLVPYLVLQIRQGKAHGHTWFTWFKPRGHSDIGSGRPFGGRLAIDTGRADVRPTVAVSEDLTPCGPGLVDFDAPERIFAAVSGASLPLTLCVEVGTTARLITIGTTGGIVVPSVTPFFDQDSSLLP